MFLPIGDSPNFRTTPWVTYFLIALNVVVFVALWPTQYRMADRRDPAAVAYRQVIAEEHGTAVAQVSVYDAIVFRHGFKPGAPRFFDIMSAMFLHGGLLHLFGNMLFLWIYGDNVEHRLGPFGYLLAYLGTGVAAALGDAMLRPDSLIPSIGASGAISGVLGFYFIWFPKNRVRVWIFLFPFLMDIFELPARVVLGIYLVIDNILPALLSRGQGGVAYGAHLGGFAAAVVVALLLDKMRVRWPERGVRRTGPAPRHAEINAAARAYLESLEKHDLAGALSTLMAMPAAACRRDLDPAQVLRLGLLLEQEGHPRAALSVYQRVVNEHQDRPVRAAARVGAARVLLDGLNMPAEAYQQLAQAMESDPPPEVEEAARELLARMRRRAANLPRRWVE